MLLMLGKYACRVQARIQNGGRQPGGYKASGRLTAGEQIETPGNYVAGRQQTDTQAASWQQTDTKAAGSPQPQTQKRQAGNGQANKQQADNRQTHKRAG